MSGAPHQVTASAQPGGNAGAFDRRRRPGQGHHSHACFCPPNPDISARMLWHTHGPGLGRRQRRRRRPRSGREGVEARAARLPPVASAQGAGSLECCSYASIQHPFLYAWFDSSKRGRASVMQPVRQEGALRQQGAVATPTGTCFKIASLVWRRPATSLRV